MALKQLFFLFLYISTAILPLTCNASTIYRVPPPAAAAAAAAAASAPRGGGGNTKSADKYKEEEERIVPFKIGRLTTFNILPRGMPFPPSGPSKRHNTINVDSAASCCS